MPESTKPHGKKQPSWLTGEEERSGAETSRTVPLNDRGGRRSQGPLAEDDIGQMQHAEKALADEGSGAAPTGTVPRVAVPGAGGEQQRAGRRPGGKSLSRTIEHLRDNPAPLGMALAVLSALTVLLWFLFLREGDQPPTAGAPGDRVIGAEGSSDNPFGGGPVRDSGVVFGALQESGEEAELDGAGLNWRGRVTQKEGEAGQTLTLEGPTAAQVERGFDLGPSGVETGVYAVAQDGGEVLHVTTHTFVPKEDGAKAEETTLGTVYSLEDGRLDGYAYYLDRRERGSDKVTRTYVRPGQSSYQVSFEAHRGVGGAVAEGRNGTFVPLLVGWRGFEDETTNEPKESSRG
ncbi:hypothetical protein GBA65_07055 [Rubrobacter marinus]|uniref:Uncharacterized protein n=1 Tax=Rubrobacter marinus TaxID=2653852 RepID=A0A6G8PVV1_9ACTN|nr:hypothetical protein [Rubrobacter marinus]QIN78313.1 hypothetical protein GBA65_07055 [Rubrobacter marinus]